MANKKKRRRKWMAVIAILLLAYVSSYFILSRRGFAQADNWNAKGFYFVFPSRPAEWKVNWCLVVVYYPLIVIDNMLGTGRPIGSEPIYRLSDGSPRVFPRCDGRELLS